MLITPNGHYTEGSLYRNPITPNGHSAENQFGISHYAEWSLHRKIIKPLSFRYNETEIRHNENFGKPICYPNMYVPTPLKNFTRPSRPIQKLTRPNFVTRPIVLMRQSS